MAEVLALVVLISRRLASRVSRFALAPQRARGAFGSPAEKQDYAGVLEDQITIGT